MMLFGTAPPQISCMRDYEGLKMAIYTEMNTIRCVIETHVSGVDIRKRND